MRTMLIGAVAAAFLAAAYAEQPEVLNQPAPELVGGLWLNTPKSRPVPLATRRGKVTVVHFWTFGCINCRHNLPIYARWHRQLAGKDVAIIGVHTPETEPERETINVTRATQQLAVEYPVLIDDQGLNWSRWHQQYWPAVYLIDKQGRIRYRWVGEMNYGKTAGAAVMTRLIEELLDEH